jgi:hypothetical protein
MNTFTLHPDSSRDRVRTNAIRAIFALPEDKPFRIRIEPYTRNRSQQQNAYLWGVCYAMLHHATGQEPNDWHEYFLGEYFGWETASAGGKDWQRPARRSSKLTTKEFTDFVEFIRARASENGLVIPDPGMYL